MKISVSYPPLESSKGTPLLSQNRQFQWFSNPTHIYPMVFATAATMLKQNGYEVSWDDGIAEGLTLNQYMNRMTQQNPEMIVIETKTPVVKHHWKIIDQIKSVLPKTKLVLVGDHVTALPEESLQQSQVDYVLTGGDYDFLLLNLCNHLHNGEEFEPGIWHRENGTPVNTGQFQQDHDLTDLPQVDRELTNWQLYAEKNGNFKDIPGTYTMVGRDCWWHRCTFCSWTTIYPKFRIRTAESLLDEIGMVIDKYGIKEVFDDTGSFPTGKWLETFCHGMIERGYNRKIRIGCNMRFGTLNQEHYNLMRQAGFRYLLFGLESANQTTLDRLDKGIQVNDIIEGCKMAKAARLEPHLTAMIGYPWETKDDAYKTVSLTKRLFTKGYASSLQATIVIPYPGTPLFHECQQKGLLISKEWDDYDMRQPVMKTSISDDDIKKVTHELYKIFFTPRYVLRTITSMRSPKDLIFVGRSARRILGHLTDFSSQQH